MDPRVELLQSGVTWPVYGLLAALFTIKAVSRTIEGQDIVLVFVLVMCGLAREGDPLLGLGLDTGRLASGHHQEWAVSAVGLVVLSRAIAGPLLGRRLAPLIESGRLNPGGAFAACRGRAIPEALAVGAAFIGLGALFEEVIFRGLIQQGICRAVSVLGLGGDAQAAAAVFGSASAFALVHWLPMRLGRVDPMVTAMAWIMPFSAGLVLGRLAVETGSLWGPWMIHSAVNLTALGASMARGSRLEGRVRGDRDDGCSARTHTAKSSGG